MASSQQRAYRFAEVELYPLQGRLMRAGQETHLRQKSFQVLTYLVQNHDRLVTKAELFDKLWSDTAVTDGVLTKCIIDIRQALGDDSHNPKFVKNIPRRGYRFVHPVEELQLNGSAHSLSVVTEETTSVEFEYSESRAEALSPVDMPHAVAALPATANFLSTRKRKLSAALAVLVLAAAVLYADRKLFTSQNTTHEAVLPQVPGKRAVVVMFFDNQSNSQELSWLREGLADMIITNLSRADNLTVLSRQQLHLLLERKGHQPGSSIQFDEALEIARRNRAEVLIMGSFATLGEQIQLNVQLYDPSDGRLLNGEQLLVDSPTQLLPQINLLATKLSAQLGSSASVAETQPALIPVGTSNLEAYRYYSLGLEKTLSFENAEAISLLEKAIELDPEFALAHARIGYTYAITGRKPEKGRPYLEKAYQMSHGLSEKDRLNIAAWYATAHLDYERAIRTYREIIKRFPLETESYYLLGRVLFGEGQVNEALEVAKQALVIDPEAKQFYNLTGTAYLGLGQPDQAIAAHQQYIRLAPKEPNAYDSLGLTYHTFGRYTEAVETYNRGLDVDPEFDLLIFHLANTHFSLGHYNEAQRLYQRFAQMAQSDDERSLAFRAIGLIHFRRGDLSKAEAMAAKESRLRKSPSLIHLILAAERGHWQKAAKLINDWGVVDRGRRGTLRYYYWQAGYLALKSGQSDEALEHFRAALKEGGPVYDIDSFEDCLANAYMQLGRTDEAIAEYERILRLNPNYPLAHYHLAQAYERRGEQQQARRYYERFLQIWKDADAEIREVIAAKQGLL